MFKLILAIALCQVAQNIANAMKCQADIHFLVDTSQSIMYDNTDGYTKSKEFMKAFADNLEIGPARIGLTAFSHKAETVFWMGNRTTEKDLKSGIDLLPFLNSNTQTGLGLKEVRENAFTSEHGARDGVPNVLIVMTDGDATDKDDLERELPKLRARTDIKVIVIAIGLSHTNYDEELLDIAGGKKENVYKVDNYKSLSKILSRLKKNTCALSKCESDIHFLVDTSGSIGDDGFDKSKSFLKSFAESVEIGPTRIGLTVFSGNPVIEFWMNKKTTLKDVEDGIDKMTYLGYGTYTAKAIKDVRENAFTDEHGDRKDARNILIIMTDGNATDAKVLPKELDLLHKRKDIRTVVVAIGKDVIEDELLDIAGGKKENVYYVEDFKALQKYMLRLRENACSPQKTTVPTTQKPKPKKKTTTPKPKQQTCGERYPTDVYFVFSQVDLSRTYVQWTTQFISHVIKRKEFVTGGFKFGIKSGCGGVSGGLTLGQYTSASSLTSTLTQYSVQHTSTLLTTVTKSYYARTGGRSGAVDVAVVVLGSPIMPKSVYNEILRLHKAGVIVFIANPSGGKLTIRNGLGGYGGTLLVGRTAKEVASDLATKLCHPVGVGK